MPPVGESHELNVEALIRQAEPQARRQAKAVHVRLARVRRERNETVVQVVVPENENVKPEVDESPELEELQLLSNQCKDYLRLTAFAVVCLLVVVVITSLFYFVLPDAPSPPNGL